MRTLFENAFFQEVDSPDAIVGKRPYGKKGEVYVHYDAIQRGQTNLTDEEKQAVKDAVILKPKNFDFDFVAVDVNKSRTVRLLKMSGIDEAHPHAIASLKFLIDDKEFKPGHIGGQIYHRMETMVSPTDPSYEFHKRVTQYEELKGLLTPAPPGHMSGWKKRIEDSGMTYDEYLDDIESLR